MVFTVEEAGREDGGHGFALRPSGRHGHAGDYVRKALASAGLEGVSMRAATLRMEAGAEVRGLVVTAGKAGIRRQ